MPDRAIANPDGVWRVERNLRRGRRRFVRHNARGIDLNRNFETAWGKRSVLSKLVPWLFRPGSHPASEPEVHAIVQTLGSRRVDRAVSLHSFGSLVLYPSAHSCLPVADTPEHKYWGRRIAQQASDSGYRVLPCSWAGLGFTQGGLELDWFHRRHGALSLLVECSGGAGLRRACAFEPFAWFNPPELSKTTARLAEALEPFVAGEQEAATSSR